MSMQFGPNADAWSLHLAARVIKEKRWVLNRETKNMQDASIF